MQAKALKFERIGLSHAGIRLPRAARQADCGNYAISNMEAAISSHEAAVGASLLASVPSSGAVFAPFKLPQGSSSQVDLT
jgi:hypothetical protein